ncbi:MAG: NAD-dependent epimerase/dehydratase family protein [Parvibaculaceae bacterium]
MTRKVLVTGASGFIGQATIEKLYHEGWPLRRALRNDATGDDCMIGDLGVATDWSASLDGITHVIHLAGHVHDPDSDDKKFNDVNVRATKSLARAAAQASVTRFVYVSSVKAHGEETFGRPWSEGDPLAPVDPYGRSKRDAEVALRRIGDETGLDIVIIRPPLVVGRGAVGNLARLMSLVARDLPLPLASVSNRRSMVSVEALAELLCLCLHHPAAAHQTFMAAEGPALSTPQLLNLIGEGMGLPPRLFSCPSSILNLAIRLADKTQAVGPVFNSLEIDADKAKNLLGWPSAPALETAIIGMAHAFAAQRRG